MMRIRFGGCTYYCYDLLDAIRICAIQRALLSELQSRKGDR